MMGMLLFWLAALWRDKAIWVGMALFGLLAGLLLSLSVPSIFVADVTLQVDTRRASSPLLADLQNTAHVALLNDVLKTPSLLADTARDTGVVVDPAGLRLVVPSPRLIKISYASPKRVNLERVTDTLAYNFIYEVLAPERLRLEQRLARVEAKLADANVDPTQRAVAASEHHELKSAVDAITAAFDQGVPQAVIWFAEPARMRDYTPRAVRHAVWGENGLWAGLLLGLLLVAGRAVTPRGPRDEKALVEVAGLPTLGMWPDIGTVRMDEGAPVVMAGQKALEPMSFTELARLHRQLMRGLHGTLVVTGVAGGEGTTLLALMLAHKSAASGKKTLLVDLNMKNVGLTHLLGQVPMAWKLVGRKKAGGIEDIVAEVGKNLALLPAPADAESVAWLRAPEKAQAFMDSLTSQYEHIIIDTSPVLAMNRQNADPVVLVGAATRSVLLVMMAVTPFNQISQVVRLLAQHGNLLGVVGNNRMNPSPRSVVLGALDSIGRVAPGLASWLRAKLR